MIINGLMPLTLLDYPGRVACTVFFAGCGLRCPFCHNAGLVLDPSSAEKITEEEFFAFLEKRKNRLTGVCVTGGEPLLRADIGGFLSKIHGMGFAVKLDTNGTEPERLKELVSAGLVDYVAMDIKNSPEEYAKTVGIENFDLSPIRSSIDFLKSGQVEYEFRTTVTKSFHTKESLISLAKWIAPAERYFLQMFVSSDNLIDPSTEGYGEKEMLPLLDEVRKIIPSAELRGI